MLAGSEERVDELNERLQLAGQPPSATQLLPPQVAGPVLALLEGPRGAARRSARSWLAPGTLPCSSTRTRFLPVTS